MGYGDIPAEPSGKGTAWEGVCMGRVQGYEARIL